MEYRKFDNIIIARIDKGEEILEQLKAIAITENIKLASINALGAINDFTVGVYKTDEKKYYSNSFKGYYEITSLTGTINTLDGEYYAHLHLSAGDEKGEVYGGHLNRAVVSATCELVITVIDGKVDRVYDEETGLNVFKFANFPFEKEVLKKAGKKDIITISIEEEDHGREKTDLYWLPHGMSASGHNKGWDSGKSYGKYL